MNSRLINLLLSLRQLFIAALHAVLICLAWYSSFGLRFDFNIEGGYWDGMIAALPIIIGTKLLIFFAFGLFQGWWKYAGMSDLLDIGMAAAVSAAVAFGLTAWVNGLTGFPRSVFLLDMMLTVLFVGGVRFGVRAYGETFRSVGLEAAPQKRVLVVGAGRTGATVVREMRTNESLRYRPVGFVDDDPQKRGLSLNGVPVRGTTEEIASLVVRHRVDEVLLAIPGATGGDIRRIVDACRECSVGFKIMPAVSDLIDGRASISRIRPVNVDDLLGRAEIVTEMAAVRANTEGHCAVVTGAAGSIGSELSWQIASMSPSRLILIERAESDLHDLELALRDRLPNVPLTSAICDILDERALDAIFRAYRPTRIYHAAAYKHVSLMERHAAVAIRNNVVGTYNVARAASAHGAERFVLISTDKAVRPTSLMGATKSAAERVVLSMNGGSTRFMAVRFGNVLGSRGSVVPIFTKQIAAGGPVTVTHPDVVRYFMTIPEAVRLVLHAGAASHGGEIFHLDMGEPVRIADLAVNMIKLSGLEPGKDVEIRFVGMRQGEKLYEELLIDGDETVPTEHPRIFSLRGEPKSLRDHWLSDLRSASDANDVARMLELLYEAVPEYSPSDQVRARTVDDAVMMASPTNES